MIGRDRQLTVSPMWPARDLIAVIVPAGQDWQREGACRGADHTLFDPAGEDERFRRYPARASYAADYCWTKCPVRAQCYQHAVDGNLSGVWGGFWHSDNTRGRKGAHRAHPIPPRTPVGQTTPDTRKAG